VTLEMVGAFFDAAATFYDRAPWRKVPGAAPIKCRVREVPERDAGRGGDGPVGASVHTLEPIFGENRPGPQAAFLGTTRTMSSAKPPQPTAIPPELDAEITPAVCAFVKSWQARISELEARIAERQRGRKTPQDCSLPPSAQHPHAKPPSRKRRSKRKRGNQPGHAKHERPLVPTDQCDEVQSLKPTECRRCGGKLSGSAPEPLRHQVWELPEIKPHVTEYQRHRLDCPCCGETTCAELPVGVPQGQSGPRLMAFIALLMACYRQSKRRTAEFLSTLLGQPCSAALAVRIETQVTAAVQAHLASQAALHSSPGCERLRPDFITLFVEQFSGSRYAPCWLHHFASATPMGKKKGPCAGAARPRHKHALTLSCRSPSCSSRTCPRCIIW